MQLIEIVVAVYFFINGIYVKSITKIFIHAGDVWMYLCIVILVFKHTGTCRVSGYIIIHSDGLIIPA